jgi:hypothetical protein
MDFSIIKTILNQNYSDIKDIKILETLKFLSKLDIHKSLLLINGKKCFFLEEGPYSNNIEKYFNTIKICEDIINNKDNKDSTYILKEINKYKNYQENINYKLFEYIINREVDNINSDDIIPFNYELNTELTPYYFFEILYHIKNSNIKEITNTKFIYVNQLKILTIIFNTIYDNYIIRKNHTARDFIWGHLSKYLIKNNIDVEKGYSAENFIYDWKYREKKISKDIFLFLNNVDIRMCQFHKQYFDFRLMKNIIINVNTDIMGMPREYYKIISVNTDIMGMPREYYKIISTNEINLLIPSDEYNFNETYRIAIDNNNYENISNFLDEQFLLISNMSFIKAILYITGYNPYVYTNINYDDYKPINFYYYDKEINNFCFLKLISLVYKYFNDIHVIDFKEIKNIIKLNNIKKEKKIYDTIINNKEFINRNIITTELNKDINKNFLNIYGQINKCSLAKVNDSTANLLNTLLDNSEIFQNKIKKIISMPPIITPISKNDDLTYGIIKKMYGRKLLNIYYNISFYCPDNNKHNFYFYTYYEDVVESLYDIYINKLHYICKDIDKIGIKLNYYTNTNKITNIDLTNSKIINIKTINNEILNIESINKNIESINLDTNSDIKKISKEKVKKIVWTQWCPGDDNKGNCFCCLKIILKSEMNVEFGHIISKFKGGEYTIDNIRPICIKCNRGEGGMHKMNMYEYIIRNNLPGIKNLKEHEKHLYLYDEKELKNTISDSLLILNKLSDNIINGIMKNELQNIIQKGIADGTFIYTVEYIKNLYSINNIK